VQRQRPSRSSSLGRTALLLGLGWLLLLGGCASGPPTFAELRLRRNGKTERLTGALLLKAPASMRFEALTAFGIPVLLVSGDERSVTLWEVMDNRA
jgi:hypothetical protein